MLIFKHRPACKSSKRNNSFKVPPIGIIYIFYTQKRINPSYFNFPKTTFNNDSTIAASSAVPKFLTPNPGTISLISIISPAFITKVKRPRVIKFTGKVRTIKIGFRIIDNTPHTTATTPNVSQFPIVKPGTILAVIKNPRALITSCINISNLQSFLFSCQIRPLKKKNLHIKWRFI